MTGTKIFWAGPKIDLDVVLVTNVFSCPMVKANFEPDGLGIRFKAGLFIK